MDHSATAGSRLNPFAVFWPVFALVFLLVVFSATTITFILPESYASTARIMIAATPAAGATGSQSSPPDPVFFQTQVELLRSELVLTKAIEELDLNTVWGKRYYDGEKLNTAVTLDLLRSRLDFRPVRNTSLLEIRAFSEDPKEAAAVADGVVKAFTAYSHSSANGAKVTVIESPQVSQRPVRPNKPLNIVIGALLGGALGVLAGGAAAMLVHFWRRKR